MFLILNPPSPMFSCDIEYFMRLIAPLQNFCQKCVMPTHASEPLN